MKIDGWTIALAACALAALACVALLFRRWRVELSAKATSTGGRIALGAGLEIAGVSASVAAILDGPGVVSIQWRGRERWRRAIPRVSLDALFDWLDAREPRESEPSWLLARTEKAALPELGLRMLLDLERPRLDGALTCGFADPVATGKTAAVLYPLAGVLAPFGTFDVRFDWSGKTILDGALDASCAVVPARVLWALAGFARRHVRWRTPPRSSSTLADPTP